MEECKLGELIDVTRGASLSGEFFSNKGEYIRLTCGNFDYINNCFKENTSKDNLFYIGKVKNEFIMEEGDIITPLTEQAIGLLGSTAIIPESGKYIQSQDVAKIQCRERLDNRYAFYLISSKMVKQQLSAGAQQTKIRHTSPDKIKDCIVWIPKLQSQQKIGAFLSSLDKKIEINREINRNLEAMAKQLYDYWFVQFDFPDENGRPYKSSGGKMVWNEKLKREIPEGWEVSPLNGWLEIKSGFAFKSDTYLTKGKYKVITIKNVQQHSLDSSNCDYVNDIPVGFKDWCQLSIGDRLISLTGNCGRLCMVSENNLLLNQRVGLLSCKPSFLDFAYLLLSSDEFQTICNNIALGAAQANLSPIDLCSKLSIVPSELILEQFNTKISPLTSLFIQNEEQIRSLTKQRDELLPLLMNGQISVG